MKDVEFLFPYQGKICPIANESCPYKLCCTDCDLYNSLGRVKKLAKRLSAIQIYNIMGQKFRWVDKI